MNYNHKGFNPMPRTAWMAVATMATVLTLLPLTAHAVTSNWINHSGGSFTTSTNWDTGVPGDDDIAVFNLGNAASYSVTFSSLAGSITSDRLVVGSNTVTFNPSIAFPANFFLDNATTIEADPNFLTPVRGITVGAGPNDTAAVLVSHLSILEAVAATLGHVFGSNGTLTLNQNNDLLNITGASSDAELIVGRLGTGVLNISNGADVAVNGTTGGMFPLPAGNVIVGRFNQGTATVTGFGSTLSTNTTLVVGDSGTGIGNLNVTAGGFVQSLTGILGNLTNSTGTATISGTDSRWKVLTLIVGNAGTGTLNVLDGGMIDFFNPSGSLSVGSLGTLNLNAGTVGGNVNNSGQINVTGPTTITGSLDVAVNAHTLIDWVEPCCSMAFAVTSGITNSGTFSVVSSVERDVTIQLGPGQSFSNNASGILNLIGSADLNADNMISGKHIIAGNVVNQGQMNVRGNTQITGSLTIAVNAETLINPAQPCCGITVEIGGPVSNSGSFTMRTHSVEPCCGVQLELGASQTFTNTATGVVNFEGPADLGGAEEIQSKNVVVGNVVNQGQMNVRGNTQITGSLTIAVNAETLINPVQPCCGITVEIGGPVSNSGSFTMRTHSAEPCCGVQLELGASQTFTNTATGVVNFEGPADLGGAEEIQSKNVVVGNVVNQGQMNVRGNTQITGSLIMAVDAQTLLTQAEPEHNIKFQVAGGVGNSGTMALVPHPDSATPCCAVTLELGAGQTLTNNESGVLQGQGTIDGSVLNRGTVRPGNSTGVLTITGDYSQESDGKIVIEVGGTTAGDEYDQLAIGGAITLDGLVEVVFAEGFSPQIGNRFEIITTAEPVGGRFVGAALPGLPEGMDWNILYGSNLVSLAITVPGDYNGDGGVDAADFLVWRKTLGQSAVPGFGADGDASGTIDTSDYAIWRTNFGQTAGAEAVLGSPHSNVPEPASLHFFLFIIATVSLRDEKGVRNRFSRRHS